MDTEIVGKGLSTLGKGAGPAVIAKAKEMGVRFPTELDYTGAAIPPRLIVPILRQIAGHFFPLLSEEHRTHP